MSSLLDVEVSCFAGYNITDNPRPVKLLTWLTSAKYWQQVEQIRQISDKDQRDALKGKLPAITPSGLFAYRAEKDLIRHSGFLQFDIDWKENKHIGNYGQLKQHICNITCVVYCGLSVSGTGYWGLVRIAHPERHKQHFNALQKAFSRLKINIDDAPSNVASLRGYSYDPEGYFNEQAVIFHQYDEPKPAPVRTFTFTPDADQERARVEYCIGEIISRSTNIAPGYDDWFQIGCSLAKAFGESGREYFLQLSSVYEGTQRISPDAQFTHCLKWDSRATLGTFFHYCQQAGISYQDTLPLTVHSAPISRPVASRSAVEVPDTYPAEWDQKDQPSARHIAMAASQTRSGAGYTALLISTEQINYLLT
ncbi:BT4734/BF3469 family protein [Nibrella viscosa]